MTGTPFSCANRSSCWDSSFTCSQYTLSMRGSFRTCWGKYTRAAQQAVTLRSLRMLRMISQAAGEVGLMPCRCI